MTECVLGGKFMFNTFYVFPFFYFVRLIYLVSSLDLSLCCV